MPSSGTWLCMSGESWFGVEYAERPVPSHTSHVQPLPKRLTPPSVRADLSASNDPNASSIAEPRSPLGAPPPSGDMIVQNREWFACPPALFRTAVRFSSATISMSPRICSTGLPAHSVPSSAAFALST
jgi:hypothetical protein